MIHLPLSRPSSLLFVACLVAMLAPPGDRFQVKQLSGPMVGISRGDAYELELTSDGTRVVYSADAFDDNQVELFAAPVDGSASPTRLNALTTVTDQLAIFPGAFRVSPDGARVVYRSDPDGNDRYEILSVPTDASAAPVTLNGALPTDRNVEPEFVITPDGNYVVYLSDQDLYQQVQLYAVPIDGSAPTVRLNGPPVTGGDVIGTGDFMGFQVTPDSTQVVYISDEEVDGQFNLYSVPIDGSAEPVRLNDPVGDLFAHLITPDGVHVVYLQIVGNTTQLFRVPVDGSSAPVGLANDAVMPFGITPDGARVVYRTSTDALYSRLLDASAAAVRLDAVPVAGGGVVEFHVAPDSQRVVYLADSQVDERFELFSAPTAGGSAPVKLSGTLVAGGDVFGNDLFVSGVDSSISISPDSSRVVYLADQEVDERFELYGAPIAGGSAAIKLHPAPVSGGDVVVSLRISADSQRVVFRGDLDADEVVELYSAPLDGSSAAVKLNGTLPFGGSVLDEQLILGFRSFDISPDGQSVVYIADETFDERREVYSVPIDGSASSQVLNDPFEVNEIAGDVTHFWVQGQEVAYRADQDTDGQFELYALDLRGGPAVKLNPALPPLGDVAAPALGAPELATVRITPAGDRVVYLADQDLDEALELYSVPSDGSASPVKLNAALSGNLDVRSGFQISPDGSRVVYRSDEGLDERIDLYSVPTDGSAAPVRLNIPRPFADVEPDFLISNDGLGVVYRADQSTDGFLELYVVDILGTTSPVKRSGPLVTGGDVADFRITSDDQHIVYRADALVDGKTELFAVPVFGSASPWKLNCNLTFAGLVNAFRVSPDGTRVAYSAVHDLSGVRELYSVPVDGSTTAIKLSAPMVTGQNVGTFEISSDGVHVVYVADQDVDGDDELFTVPIDGSASSVQLNLTLAPSNDVRSFLISTDGTRVVFVQSNASQQPIELYGVRIDAGAPAVMLNDPPLSGGSVETGKQLSIHGPHVYYVGREAAAPGSNQLYRVPLVGGALPTKVSSSLVISNNQWSLFTVTDGGRNVLYRDDAEESGTGELYQATFAPTKVSTGRVPPF